MNSEILKLVVSLWELSVAMATKRQITKMADHHTFSYFELP